MSFRHSMRIAAVSVMLATPGLAVAQQSATTVPAKHHSKLKGALVGAVAGHAMGGHAKSGALVGALVQHHRNKVAAKGAVTAKP